MADAAVAVTLVFEDEMWRARLEEAKATIDKQWRQYRAKAEAYDVLNEALTGLTATGTPVRASVLTAAQDIARATYDKSMRPTV